jgi:hypothetical protein
MIERFDRAIEAPFEFIDVKDTEVWRQASQKAAQELNDAKQSILSVAPTDSKLSDAVATFQSLRYNQAVKEGRASAELKRSVNEARETLIGVLEQYIPAAGLEEGERNPFRLLPLKGHSIAVNPYPIETYQDWMAKSVSLKVDWLDLGQSIQSHTGRIVALNKENKSIRLEGFPEEIPLGKITSAKPAAGLEEVSEFVDSLKREVTGNGDIAVLFLTSSGVAYGSRAEIKGVSLPDISLPENIQSYLETNQLTLVLNLPGDQEPAWTALKTLFDRTVFQSVIPYVVPEDPMEPHQFFQPRDVPSLDPLRWHITYRYRSAPRTIVITAAGLEEGGRIFRIEDGVLRNVEGQVVPALKGVEEMPPNAWLVRAGGGLEETQVIVVDSTLEAGTPNWMKPLAVLFLTLQEIERAFLENSRLVGKNDLAIVNGENAATIEKIQSLMKANSNSPATVFLAVPQLFPNLDQSQAAALWFLASRIPEGVRVGYVGELVSEGQRYFVFA